MKKLNLLILSTLAFMALKSNAELWLLPENANSEIVKKFPQCSSVANISPKVGSLYGENTQDIVTHDTCDDGVNRIFVLIKQKDGSYQIVGTNEYDTTGSYDGFGVAIDRKSLFLSISYLGREIADSYQYEFAFDGKKVMLIRMMFQTDYHGDGEPNEENANYQVSVNYLTGVVTDSRKKSEKKRRGHLKKITLEEFHPGMEFLDGVIDGN